MVGYLGHRGRPPSLEMASHFNEEVRAARMGWPSVGDDGDGFHEVGNGDLGARDGEGDGGCGGVVGS